MSGVSEDNAPRSIAEFIGNSSTGTNVVGENLDRRASKGKSPRFDTRKDLGLNAQASTWS